ncbi:ABC transporter substrate-binding protein [Adhaeribacter sp. BT258]|uniref:ABC transporter substrate-binding protein n=1 Tax=Adhaeribacter terrigena TaxID=2793070 RepID=A0ABS1BYY3_9BACT|nr:ABC transporter substrate-binding protein [Adhaeribacter terrigena]MBK0402324.1 ABC transporter substrate-binding protein [Adhaeribacter terrigena]
MPETLSFFQKFFFSFLLTILLSGCGETTEKTLSDSAQKVEANKITVTDDLGRKLEIPAQPKRVMALSAAMTEMLFAVVPDSLIVARTQVCNFPEAALKKPVVNSYPLDLEGLLVLKPEIIFTEDGITSMETAAKIEQLGIPVYFQKYEKVTDIFRGLNDIGKIMRRETEAQKLTDSLQTELNAIENEVKTQELKRALVVINTDPIYVYGRNTLMTDKLEKAGGQNALQENFPQQSPQLTREYVLQLNPGFIFGISQVQNEAFFRLYPELKKVDAYKNKRIFNLNDDLAARPSPRVVESVREIRNYLQK